MWHSVGGGESGFATPDPQDPNIIWSSTSGLGAAAGIVVRYNERTAVERVNGRLKDEFGARMIRVRGHAKVMCHLMFGVLALTADQLIRFLE